MNEQSGQDTNDKENFPLIHRHLIQDTPFYIVGNDEIGYHITWGKYRFNVEPIKPTMKEAMDWFLANKWHIIWHMISIAISTMDKYLEGNNQPE